MTNTTTTINITFRNNSPNFPVDPPAGLSPAESLRYRIVAQSMAIVDCEMANSYTSHRSGAHGAAVRAADYAALRGLYSKLSFYTGTPDNRSSVEHCNAG
jgi:hypothetical protein